MTHPFFAPTVLDGGVSKYTTGQESEEFITGFLGAERTEKLLQAAGVPRDQSFRASLTLPARPTQPILKRELEGRWRVRAIKFVLPSEMRSKYLSRPKLAGPAK